MNKYLLILSKNWLKIILIVSSYFLTVISSADPRNDFISDVIGVEENMLYPDFWTNKISDGDNELLTMEQIIKKNKMLFSSNTLMTEINEYPLSLSSKTISKKILNISSPSSSKRFYGNKKEVSRESYDSYYKALNLSALPDQQTIRFGLVVKRTNMRTFPTDDKIYKTPTDTNLDRFQETALFPTEAVAILHESLDKKWFFAVSYNYSAWVKKQDIALGDRDVIMKYKQSDNFLVITGSKIHTTFNPDNKQTSELQLEMGTTIPFVEKTDIPNTLGDQNTYASHVVTLPARDQQGNLIFQMALVPKSADVQKGFLAFTKDNLINQSFKFLGERYGWGHSFNARDCTGFVGEIYKSFGILMPRNSGDQGRSEQGENANFLKTASKSKKLSFIQQLQTGDLIYIPGHVMMVLGFHENQPFIIHDVSGLSYFKADGEYYRSALNGVSMTPLLPLQLSNKTSYIDKIYNIKKIK